MVSPAPGYGAVFEGRGVLGRALRISSHVELGLVVLSIWQDERCLATVRLSEAEVPQVIHALAASLVPPAEVRPAHARTAS